MDEGLIVRSRGLSWPLKVEAGCSVGWAPTRQHVTTRPGLGLRGEPQFIWTVEKWIEGAHRKRALWLSQEGS